MNLFSGRPETPRFPTVYGQVMAMGSYPMQQEPSCMSRGGVRSQQQEHYRPLFLFVLGGIQVPNAFLEDNPEDPGS